jgi:hypothetical protein
MAGSSRTTTDHKTIQKWVEEREGQPVTVRGTGSDQEAGVLRIDFPGGAGEDRLEPISWEEFFEKFDEKGLAFLYQEETRDGEQSRFFKFVSREGSEDDKSKGKDSDKKGKGKGKE